MPLFTVELLRSRSLEEIVDILNACYQKDIDDQIRTIVKLNLTDDWQQYLYLVIEQGRKRNANRNT